MLSPVLDSLDTTNLSLLDFPKPQVTRVGHNLGVVPFLMFSMDIHGGLDIHGASDLIKKQTVSGKCS
jgi:hypothetical protein